MKLAGRLLLCLVTLGAALAGVGYGIVLLGFEIAAEPIRAEAAGKMPPNRLAFRHKPVDVPSEVARWRDIPGTAAAARLLVVEDSARTIGLNRRIFDTVRALETQPTAGDLWIEYASLGHRLGFDPRAQLRALEMASLTQRREADTMYWCAVLTITLWKEADAAQKSRAVSALAELRPSLRARETSLLARALAEKAPGEREEISARLRAALPDADIFTKQMGL